MNWFKKAQTVPIRVLSYNQSYGELKISFNGGKGYTYYGVSPYLYERIDRLLGHRNYRKVNEMLRNLVDNSQMGEN